MTERYPYYVRARIGDELERRLVRLVVVRLEDDPGYTRAHAIREMLTEGAAVCERRLGIEDAGP